MIEIARAVRLSPVAPERFFHRWCDLATHPEWAADMEFLRLDEPFRIGARGVLKVRGGHEAPFVVTECVEGRAYADTTLLDDVELTVHHEAIATAAGTEAVLRAWVTGAGAQAFGEREAASIQESLEVDLEALASLLEREVAGVSTV
jgi:hypothetical protein